MMPYRCYSVKIDTMDGVCAQLDLKPMFTIWQVIELAARYSLLRNSPIAVIEIRDMWDYDQQTAHA